jgi:hypothetical protein
MMRWLFVLMLCFLPAAAPAQTTEPVDIAIVVALDRSESIDFSEARAQIDGLIYTLRNSRFRYAVGVGWHGGIALSVVTWSSFGRHEVILPWMWIANGKDADVAAAILELDYARQATSEHGPQTDVAFAIEVGMKQLDALPWPATKNVINVVADGISNIGRCARVDRNVAMARGITVNGLIMADGPAIDVLSRYFRREVIGGLGSFLELATSNDQFAAAMLRKILLEMARLREPNATQISWVDQLALNHR